MQKCFLVSNKSTQVREYLEHRSIVQVVEEHRSLNEIDPARIGIVDVEKFIYIYYESDDGDLAFRTDLNVLRGLLNSPFFHVDDALFILVGCQNPMLEDFIISACRGTEIVGSHLEVVHHAGALSLNDVSRYVVGTAMGSEVSSTYKTVYITEEESAERERYTHQADGIDTMLPALTDQYSMYKKRAEVEAVSSGRTVNEVFIRPQIMREFSHRQSPSIQQWNAFLVSGDLYTGYERSVEFLVDYYTRTGVRTFVVDLCSSNSIRLQLTDCKEYSLGDLRIKTTFTERTGRVKCRYNQLGYLIEMLDNVESAQVFIFMCDKQEYNDVQQLLYPLCDRVYSDFVTHFSEDALQDYIDSGLQATTLFLSRRAVYEPFEVSKYRDDFKHTRVASFGGDRIDTVDFHSCAIGGGPGGR